MPEIPKDSAEQSGPRPVESSQVVGAEAAPAAQVKPAWNPLAEARAEIVELGHKAVRELLEMVKADQSTDAYAILELMCVNELINARLKTREMDALELYRARNQGKGLTLKAARLQRQNKLDEARTEKLQLETQTLRNEMAKVREKVQQAGEAKERGKPFDYERALNQISAVIGLRGPEEFRFEKPNRQPS